MFRDLQYGDRALFLSMMGDFYSSGVVARPVDSKNFETTFAAAMDRSPFIRALIVEDAGAPAGYALLSFTYSNEAGGLTVWLEELYIRAAYRGRGHGRRLLEFLEREYPSARRFRLEITEENRDALRLYERLGYRALDYRQMVKDI